MLEEDDYDRMLAIVASGGLDSEKTTKLGDQFMQLINSLDLYDEHELFQVLCWDQKEERFTGIPCWATMREVIESVRNKTFDEFERRRKRQASSGGVLAAESGQVADGGDSSFPFNEWERLRAVAEAERDARNSTMDQVFGTGLRVYKPETGREIPEPKVTRGHKHQLPKTPEHKFKMISFYNHKGGVGKTTSLQATAFELAAQGQRVLMVDADPQRNLTQSCLHYFVEMHQNQPTDFRRFCVDNANLETIYTMVEPCITTNVGTRDVVKVPKLWQFAGFNGLFLMAGDEKIQEMDDKISGMQRLIGQDETIRFQARLTFGMFYHGLKRTAYNANIDTVLIDLSPSAGVFNKIMLLSSNYFVVPAHADYFSEEAFNSLRDYMTAWVGASEREGYRNFFSESMADPDCPYPLPIRGLGSRLPRLAKFLGTVLCRVGYSGGGKAESFNVRQYLKQVQEAAESFVARLDEPTRHAGHVNLQAMSMNQCFPGYYETIGKNALPSGDGMKVDIRSSTLSVVKEFHQLSWLSQRLSLPVSFLDVQSTKFRKFNGNKAEAYEVSVYAALGHGLHPPPVQTINDWLKVYPGGEIPALTQKIDRSRVSYQRIAHCIMVAPDD